MKKFIKKVTIFLLLCRCLALRNNQFLLRQKIRQKTFPWENLIELSGKHLVTTTLYWSLRQKKLLNELPDDGLLNYLETIFSANQQRNQQILEQLYQITKQLNSVGIEPVVLKGVASLVTQTYADIGIRMMTDIDLLIPKNKLMEAVNVLIASGYYPAENAPDSVDKHHYPALIRQGSIASVELHSRIVLNETKILPTEMVLKNAVFYPLKDVQIKCPTLLDRIKHNIIHTYIMDGNYEGKTIQLMQLYEFATLNQLKTLDLKKLKSVFKENNQSELLATYRAMANYLLLKWNPLIFSFSTAKYCIAFKHKMDYKWTIQTVYSRFYKWVTHASWHLITSFKNVFKSPLTLLHLLNPAWYKKQMKVFKKF